MRLLFGMLAAASWLVPREFRSEWRREWRSELWFVWRTRGWARAASFCLGAFVDAFWMRRNSPPAPPRERFRLETASECGFFLAALAALSLAALMVFPRAQEDPPPRDDLVMLSPHRYFAAQAPSTTIEQYRLWSQRTGDVFAQVAFYQPVWREVQTGKHGLAPMAIARVSGNVFALLRCPMPADARLLLSHAAWRKYFDGDPHIAGRMLQVAGRTMRVAAVLPADFLRLPGRVDVWLLAEEPPPEAKGFVIAELKPPLFNGGTARPRRLSVADENGDDQPFYYQALAEKSPPAVIAFLAVVGVSCILLPVTTTLSLGEYSGRRARQRLFFWTKIGLILVIVFCVSRFVSNYRWSGGGAVQLLIASCVLAFRWALIDQRRRCPVCLRLVCNPVRVGQVSMRFLGWSGTEFMCVRGHGLLHVPEFPTSWFSTQRWLYLDASWSGLFR